MIGAKQPGSSEGKPVGMGRGQWVPVKLGSVEVSRDIGRVWMDIVVVGSDMVMD